MSSLELVAQSRPKVCIPACDRNFGVNQLFDRRSEALDRGTQMPSRVPTLFGGSIASGTRFLNNKSVLIAN
jgi:hypothetical protein